MSFSLELFESRGEIPGAIVREKRGRKLETVFFFFFQALHEADRVLCGVSPSMTEKGLKQVTL